MLQRLIITNKKHITSVTQLFISCLTRDDLANIDIHQVGIRLIEQPLSPY
jgi:hypothetical protein